ncbi:MAG: C25 family cysteine peptidase [Oligoflexales bacterium]
MKRIFLTLLMTFYPFFSFAESIQVKSNINAYKTEILTQDDKKIVVRFELGDFNRESDTIGIHSFNKLKLKGASYLRKKSFPELPQLVVPLTLPKSLNIQLKILSSEYKLLDLGIPKPSKGDIERSVNPKNVPYTFANLYNINPTSLYEIEPYPKNIIKLSKPYMLRKMHGVNLTIYPFQYMPKSKLFKVYTSIELSVSFESIDYQRTKIHNSNLDNFFSSRFANWKKSEKQLTYESRSKNSPKGKILIIAGDQFINTDLEAFAIWKRQLGYQVKTVKMSEIGSNSQDLKNYIQTEYDIDTLLGYVILVGDAEHVPYFKGTSGNARNNEADPMYGLVAGDDSYPDLIVGRISVKNAGDLNNILSKSIEYEKNPAHGDWFRSALGIASDEGSPTDGERANKIKNVLLASDKYDHVESLYDPDVDSSHIVEAINAGQSLVNYIGHGWETAWVTGYFRNRDIEKLTNGRKLPVIISVACVNGKFSYEDSDSFAEQWLKVGQAGNPKGAIAIFASSTNQSWIPPTIGQLEISRLIASDQVFTVGSLMMSGSIAVLRDGSHSAKQTFQTWHIFGDPSLEFKSEAPMPIKLFLLSSDLPWGEAYNLGDSGLRFSITDKSSLIFTQESDEGGMIQLPKAELLSNKKDLTLTVSGKNKVPLIKKISLDFK